jgi:apolipoprotein N-acyltransferase
MNFFPLGYLGYTQTNLNHIIQIADLGGVFLVGFIISLINSLLFKFIVSKRKKYIFISIMIVGLVLSYGFYQINRYEDIEKSLDIGIVHTHINQNDKWNRDNINKYIDLFTTQDEAFEDVDLIITPESALTFDMNREVYYRDKVMNRVEPSNKYFQIGFLATKDNKSNYYNSIYLINPEGEIKNRYNKNKLLLFGEYVIFSDLIEKITGYRLNTLNPGKNIVNFQTPFAKWKTVICSEILYPEYVSKHLNSLDFIVNQSNEAWFEDNTTLKNQMYASLVFRTIENRRSIIKAGNMTYSGIVYPSGQREKYNKKTNEKLKLSIKKHKEITLFNKIMNVYLNN